MIHLCDILSRSNMAVGSYSLDTVLDCVQCDLDLGDMCHWVKVMTQPLVMDNNCVKHYPDSTWQ